MRAIRKYALSWLTSNRRLTMLCFFQLKNTLGRTARIVGRNEISDLTLSLRTRPMYRSTLASTEGVGQRDFVGAFGGRGASSCGPNPFAAKLSPPRPQSSWIAFRRVVNTAFSAWTRSSITVAVSNEIDGRNVCLSVCLSVYLSVCRMLSCTAFSPSLLPSLALSLRRPVSLCLSVALSPSYPLPLPLSIFSA